MQWNCSLWRPNQTWLFHHFLESSRTFAQVGINKKSILLKRFEDSPLSMFDLFKSPVFLPFWNQPKNHIFEELTEKNCLSRCSRTAILLYMQAQLLRSFLKRTELHSLESSNWTTYFYNKFSTKRYFQKWNYPFVHRFSPNHQIWTSLDVSN